MMELLKEYMKKHDQRLVLESPDKKTSSNNQKEGSYFGGKAESFNNVKENKEVLIPKYHDFLRNFSVEMFVNSGSPSVLGKYID